MGIGYAATAEPAVTFFVTEDRLGLAAQLVRPDGTDQARVERLPGEPDQWFAPGMNEFLVIRNFPLAPTFAQLATALQEGKGAACGLQPIQRVDSYWDSTHARSYCLYRAGSSKVLHDAFLWLGLPAASIHAVRPLPRDA